MLSTVSHRSLVLACHQHYPPLPSVLSLSEGLQTWLNHRGDRAPLQEKLSVAAYFMHAVAALHKNNLVWTDLKPANFVMISNSFGICWKAIDMDSVVKVTTTVVSLQPLLSHFP